MQLTFDWKFTALDRLIFMVYMYFHEKEACIQIERQGCILNNCICIYNTCINY